MGQILKKIIYVFAKIMGLTNVITRITSVTFFLPSLFRLRYANFGGISPDRLWEQMGDCRSFEEDVWCDYWNTLADEQEADARQCLAKNNSEAASEALQKAIAYYSISAFPGHTPKRLSAYRSAERVFDASLELLTHNLGKLFINKVTLEIEDEVFSGYLVLPDEQGQYPVTIVTNGLEGTIPELILPLKDMTDLKIGAFFMEMPGTYQYRKPLSIDSSKIYQGVIDYLESHPRVNPDRIGIVGLSFGAHWSARMAALDPRLKCAVANGGNYTFPLAIHSEILIKAIRKVTGSHSLKEVVKSLKSLSFHANNNDLYSKIKMPLLVINGSKDTLFPTRESVLLAEKAPNATLKLYDGDDHCAMEHYQEMIEFIFDWVSAKLLDANENPSETKG